VKAALRRPALTWLALVSLLALSRPADARQFGIQSPAGRRIYGSHERFDELIEHRRRIIVTEVAVGAGPEGNLALLLGCLNLPVRRLDLFAGVGLEANPAALFTGSARYTFQFGPVRPYVALGYLFKDTYAVGVHSHNVFAEVGHTWVLHRTLRLSLGVGLRRILHTGLDDDSALLGPDAEPGAVQREIERVWRWLPLGAIRFSRAF
jgi:hypothetical protein